VVLTDDLDGSAGAETVQLGYLGQQYELDLSKKNRQALDKLLKPYLEAARRPANGRTNTRTRRGSASPKRNLSDIREWAQANGHSVSARGRIARSIVEEYEAAH